MSVRRTGPLLLVGGLLALAACRLPEWRIGQRKVPADAGPSAATVEAQRRAAQYIAQASAAPGVRSEPGSPAPDPVRQLETIHAVAVPLSASLGEPQRPATAADQAAILADLRTATLEAQAKAERWREFARKYAGHPLEDTGLNLAGPAGLLGLVGVVALCVAFPPVGYLLLRALPLLWGFFRRTTTAIGGYIAAHPDGAEDLKTRLSRSMDAAHKALVKRHAARG